VIASPIAHPRPYAPFPTSYASDTVAVPTAATLFPTYFVPPQISFQK